MRKKYKLARWIVTREVIWHKVYTQCVGNIRGESVISGNMKFRSNL